MAFGFSSVIATLESAYEARTGQPIAFVGGEQARHQHDTIPPCVLVLHAGGTHELAGKASTGDDARSEHRVVSVAAEMLRFECHATTERQAYRLWANVCVLLRELYADAVELGNLGWLTQEQRAASPMLDRAVKWQAVRFRTVLPASLAPLDDDIPEVERVVVESTGHDIHLVSSLDQTHLPPSCGHNEDPTEDP